MEGRGGERKTERGKENRRKLTGAGEWREREMRKWRETEKSEVLPNTGCGGEVVAEGGSKEMRREEVGRKRECLDKEKCKLGQNNYMESVSAGKEG